METTQSRGYVWELVSHLRMKLAINVNLYICVAPTAGIWKGDLHVGLDNAFISLTAIFLQSF
jgi:hypothetical protein